MAAESLCSYWFSRQTHFPNSSGETRIESSRIKGRINPSWVHPTLAAFVQCHQRWQLEVSTPQHSGKEARNMQLWLEFFSDPCQWWDSRLTKKGLNHPDFVHKTTFEALWVDSWLNPPWVRAKMATMTLDNLQSRVSDSFCDDDKVIKLCEDGRLIEALHMLKIMVQQNMQASVNGYVCLLKECSRRKALAEGKQVHALMIHARCDSNIFLANNLIDMYSKCGCVLDARKVFAMMPERNVFSWTGIISAYVDTGQFEEAFKLFQQMQETGIAPDKVVFVVVLKACAKLGALEQGRELHSLILKSGFQSDLILQNALIEMYAKCRYLEDAQAVFNNMTERDVVSWTAMIAGSAENESGEEALALYEQMKQDGVQPNKVTFVVVLQACAGIAALKQGKQVHLLIQKKGFESDVIIQSALVDMYAKCGCLEDAREVFDNMVERNVVCWNAMMSGYAQNGLGKEALALYEQMKLECVQPNEVTFICVLSACSHSGLVEEGHCLFDSMCKVHGVQPNLDHYACIVDLLGRAGRLVEAEDFILKMPIQPNRVVWISLLGAARKHGNAEIGRHAFDCVMELEPKPKDVSPYLLLIDIYSATGRIDEAAKIRKEMKDKGLEISNRGGLIKVDNQARTFIASEASHLKSKHICAELERPVGLMEKA